MSQEKEEKDQLLLSLLIMPPGSLPPYPRLPGSQLLPLRAQSSRRTVPPSRPCRPDAPHVTVIDFARDQVVLYTRFFSVNQHCQYPTSPNLLAGCPCLQAWGGGRVRVRTSPANQLIIVPVCFLDRATMFVANTLNATAQFREVHLIGGSGLNPPYMPTGKANQFWSRTERSLSPRPRPQRTYSLHARSRTLGYYDSSNVVSFR